MDVPGGTVVGYSSLEGRLAELRERRMLLRALCDDVDLAARSLAPVELAGSWRSEAQRGYADRRSELAGELRQAARLLDDAHTDLQATIERVKAALAEARALTGVPP